MRSRASGVPPRIKAARQSLSRERRPNAMPSRASQKRLHHHVGHALPHRRNPAPHKRCSAELVPRTPPNATPSRASQKRPSRRVGHGAPAPAKPHPARARPPHSVGCHRAHGRCSRVSPIVYVNACVRKYFICARKHFVIFPQNTALLRRMMDWGAALPAARHDFAAESAAATDSACSAASENQGIIPHIPVMKQKADGHGKSAAARPQ